MATAPDRGAAAGPADHDPAGREPGRGAAMRIRGNVLVIALVVLGVAAGLTGLVHGDDAFKIGVIQPITGPWAYDGLRVVDGAKVAVEMINAAGGVNGKRITLIVEDNKGAPTDSVSAAE